MAVVLMQYGQPQHQFSHLASQRLSEAFTMGGAVSGAETVADLSPDDDLLLPMSSRALTARLRNVRCRVSLIMIEPPAIQMRYYRIMPLLGLRYHRIFTYSHELQKRLRNAVHLPHGGASINPPPPSAIQKTRLVSMIASKKRITPGHCLRHRVAAWAQASGSQLERFGRGFCPVESVATALSPFRFSVVIENSRFPNYFTEKLIDCLLCRTIPIYWGDPNIAAHFNSAGIIACPTEADLYRSLAQCTPQGYQERLEAIEENAARAMQLAVSPVQRAARHLLASAEGHNNAALLNTVAPAIRVFAAAEMQPLI
jgi:hypothetical protein